MGATAIAISFLGGGTTRCAEQKIPDTRGGNPPRVSGKTQAEFGSLRAASVRLRSAVYCHHGRAGAPST